MIIGSRPAVLAIRPDHEPLEPEAKLRRGIKQRTVGLVPRASVRVLLFSDLVNKFSHSPENSLRNRHQILLDTSPILRY
jgi:hypothetical protein